MHKGIAGRIGKIVLAKKKGRSVSGLFLFNRETQTAETQAIFAAAAAAVFSA